MDKLKDEDYRWVRGGSKSIALLWLTTKESRLDADSKCTKASRPKQ